MAELVQALDDAAAGKLTGPELGETGKVWTLRRIVLGGEPATAIYAKGPVRDWVSLRGQFHSAGISVPVLLAANRERGDMLVEDLGNCRLVDLSANEATELYRDALGLVILMQRNMVPGKHTDIVPFSRIFDETALTAELDRFVDAALPALYNIPSRGSHVEPVRIEFARLARDIAALPRFCAHRAFNAKHMHLTPARRLVVTAFEGAFMAPPHYDLASLFFDGWGFPPRELREELLSKHAEKGKEFLPAWDVSTSKRAFGRVALQRILGELGRIAEDYPQEKLPGLKSVLANLAKHLVELCKDDKDLESIFRPLSELIPAFAR